MAGRRPGLRPDPGSRGLASGDPAEATALVRAAYDGAASLARSVDLDGPSRLPEWSRRDVLVHLGAWPEHRSFAGLLDDARHGRVHEVDDADARNAMIVAAHTDATSEDVARALEEARDRAVSFLESPEALTVGLRSTESPVGPLPVVGVVVASAFEVAVHLLDVAPADAVPAQALEAGIGALVDITGALTARHQIAATLAVSTPAGTWACCSLANDWTTAHLDPDVRAADLGWPTIEGSAGDVLDAASGRVNPTQLVLARRVRLHDVPGLMEVLPALEAVPGLPGGAAGRALGRALGQTGRVLGQTARLMDRLGGVVRRP